MIWKTTLMLLASALAVSVAADAADAKSKQRKRIAPPVAAQQAPAFHQQPRARRTRTNSRMRPRREP